MTLPMLSLSPGSGLFVTRNGSGGGEESELYLPEDGQPRCRLRSPAADFELPIRSRADFIAVADAHLAAQGYPLEAHRQHVREVADYYWSPGLSLSVETIKQLFRNGKPGFSPLAEGFALGS